MRVNAITLAIAVTALLTATSCKDSGDISVKGVSLSEPAITLSMGTTKELKANIVPKKAANQSVIWESADKSIATVDRGIVKGIKDGKTKVTVTTLDGFFTAECDVTVETVKPEKMKVSSYYTIEVGKSVRYDIKWVPENANMGYSVNSSLWSNNAIEVDEQNRTVKGIKPGRGYLRIATFDNSLEEVIYFNVVESFLYPTDFRIFMDQDYKAGTSVDLNAWSTVSGTPTTTSGNPLMQWEPSDANYRELNVKSNDESIVSVEDIGANKYRMQFLKAGKTGMVFTSYPPSGKSILRTGEIYVHDGTPKFSIDKSDKNYWYAGNGSTLILIQGGSPYTLNFLYENIYHNDAVVTNPDSFKDYVTLDGKKVTAIKLGSTNIAFRSKDNYSLTSSASIRIFEKPTNLTVSSDGIIELKKGATALISLYTYPRKTTVGRYDIKTSGYVSAEITSSLFKTWSSYSSFDNTRTLEIKAGNNVGTGTVTITHKDNPSVSHTFNVRITN